MATGYNEKGHEGLVWEDTRRRATMEVEDVMKAMRSRVLDKLLAEASLVYKQNLAQGIIQRVTTSEKDVRRAFLDALVDPTVPGLGTEGSSILSIGDGAE